jgi:hypothetical protein
MRLGRGSFIGSPTLAADFIINTRRIPFAERDG